MEQSPRDVIEAFAGADRFLSNFWPSLITWRGREAPTVEHHYNAAKTLDPHEQNTVYAQDTPGKAKRTGQEVTLQPNWDNIKAGIMEELLRLKFAPGTDLARRLTATGDALLLEGNTWHDQYWGQCTCEQHYHWAGGNTLGRLLMQVRADLRPGPLTLPRIGVTGHRLQHLSLSQRMWAASILPPLLRSLHARHGAQVAISGMALGVDTMWAEAAVREGLRLWAYIPCETQAARWDRTDRLRWAHLRAEASREIVLAPNYDVRYMRSRNDFVVRDSDVLVAVHHTDMQNGGTARTIRRAEAKGARIIHVNVSNRTVYASTPQGDVPWVF